MSRPLVAIALWLWVVMVLVAWSNQFSPVLRRIAEIAGLA
jgi:hypothetical protein